MTLLAIGLNHTTAPVDIRERVVFAPDRQNEALQQFVAVARVREAAILSTCNRTELYCGQEQAEIEQVIRWFGEYHGLKDEDLAPYLYTHPEQSAVRHILRVACGLDSMVIGEPQILGQMKSAYQAASEAGTLGRVLERLFQHTFSVAKQVRTDTSIGTSAVSVASAAVSLAIQIFGDLSKRTALLIGAGDTIELAARHLHQHKLQHMVIANRTAMRARELARHFNAYAISLDEIAPHLAEVDIVIASTASPEPVLELGMVREAFRTRKHRPIFMVDIAVPRDIEPAVGDLDDVYLYTVDDLQEVIEHNMNSRREAAEEAEEIIDVNVARFMGWIRSLDAISTIRELRSDAERTRDETLLKAIQMLESGKPPAEVMEQLAHSLTNKLIHQPSATLRHAASEGRDTLLEAARELYDLKGERKDR